MPFGYDGDMSAEWEKAICLLDGKTKKQAILEVLGKCGVFDSLDDKDRFLRAVFRRERIETTGIGHGVAVAHGKILGLRSVLVALGISREGIDYGSLDGKPVHLLFLIASSPATQLAYLKVLGRLLSSAREKDVRELLDNYRDDAFDPFFKEMVESRFAWLWKEPSTTSPPPEPH